MTCIHDSVTIRSVQIREQTYDLANDQYPDDHDGTVQYSALLYAECDDCSTDLTPYVSELQGLDFYDLQKRAHAFAFTDKMRDYQI